MEYAANASKLHKKIGEILSQTSPFKDGTLRQEVIVSELFPDFYNGRFRYDWVIPDHHTIIEAHGIQHYKVRSFGADAGDAILNFRSQKFKDSRKEEIALLNGWTYLIIPFSDEKKITSEYLLDLFITCRNPNPVKPPEVKEDRYAVQHRAALDRAKIYRREQYLKQKERLKHGNKKHRSNTTSE